MDTHTYVRTYACVGCQMLCAVDDRCVERLRAVKGTSEGHSLPLVLLFLYANNPVGVVINFDDRLLLSPGESMTLRVPYINFDSLFLLIGIIDYLLSKWIKVE
ncbi:hypothetical protein CBL_04308 [Carabus blaptoides fortunei]